MPLDWWWIGQHRQGSCGAATFGKTKGSFVVAGKAPPAVVPPMFSDVFSMLKGVGFGHKAQPFRTQQQKSFPGVETWPSQNGNTPTTPKVETKPPEKSKEDQPVSANPPSLAGWVERLLPVVFGSLRRLTSWFGAVWSDSLAFFHASE